MSSSPFTIPFHTIFPSEGLIFSESNMTTSPPTKDVYAPGPNP